MGFAGLRVKHVHHRMSLARRADPNPACATGGFYKSPSNGATVDSMQPLPIAWDPTCLSTTTADIYLFSPNSSQARIHVWQEVPFSAASYNATIMPRWWNSTSSQKLQIAIVPAGVPPFMTTLPAGPVITATYTAPPSGQPIPAAADTSQVDSGITQVNAGIAVTSSTLSPGKVAAAVLLPLLFVALGIAAYLRFQRAKQQDKTKRFSEVLDKRMSTISADWKSISAAGANAAIRSSMASGGVRNSTAFTFSGVRPASAATISMVPGQAGVGSFGFNNNNNNNPGSAGEMAQVRTGTGVGLRHPNASSLSVNSAERVSRISFAADTRFSRTSTHADARPSMDSSRRGVPSRAFHSAYVPPVPPVRPDVASLYTKEKDAELSPRQAAGPLTLTPEDIRARMHGGPSPNSSSGTENGIDEVMPALSLMRTGSLNGSRSGSPLGHIGNAGEGDDYLLSFPEPVHHPANVVPAAMSPDEMLRQYAAQRAANGGISTPTPPPSAASNWNKVKGRTLSLRNGFGIGRKTKEKGIEGGPGTSVGGKGVLISYPVPAAGGEGGHYAIGEEEEVEEDYGDAYGGVSAH